MAIRVTKTFTRTSTGQPLYEISEEFRTHLDTTYITPGLQTNRSFNVSENGLTINYVTEWRDQAAYDQFMNDPVCKEMFALRKAYNQTNNITTGPGTVESI